MAIVGTRKPDVLAGQFAHTLARELVEAGCSIVSGGALGIDTTAHQGALDGGGFTVAILATGLEHPYPADNGQLFRRIAEQGALVSESLENVPGYASAFLARNRLIAALASVVVVVQAPNQSGAMSTAKHALKLGRPLLAVPYAPWEGRGAGCLALLATGAQVCRSSADVLSHLAPSERKPAGAPPRRAHAYEGDLDEDERLALRSLSSDVLTADDLCERTAMSAARAQRAILMLLLSGLIQEVGAGRYARR